MKINKKETKILYLGFLLLITAFLFFGGLARGMTDPSATYCNKLGYQWETLETEEGYAGACILPDETIVDAWDFLRGKEKAEYSYCALQGYDYETVYADDRCDKIFSEECLLCILPDGTKKEVMTLMIAEDMLTEEEYYSGNYFTEEGHVPEPEKEPEEKVATEAPGMFLFWFTLLIFILALAAVIYFLFRKKKD